MTTKLTTDLHDRLIAALHPDDQPHDVLDAALDLFGFQLSTLCPDCRKQAVRAIKRAIPNVCSHMPVAWRQSMP